MVLGFRGGQGWLGAAGVDWQLRLAVGVRDGVGAWVIGAQNLWITPPTHIHTQPYNLLTCPTPHSTHHAPPSPLSTPFTPAKCPTYQLTLPHTCLQGPGLGQMRPAGPWLHPPHARSHRPRRPASCNGPICVCVGRMRSTQGPPPPTHMHTLVNSVHTPRVTTSRSGRTWQLWLGTGSC